MTTARAWWAATARAALFGADVPLALLGGALVIVGVIVAQMLGAADSLDYLITHASGAGGHS